MRRTVLILFLALAAGCRSPGEWTLSGYLGASDTRDSDLQLEQPGGTDLRFEDVNWSDESFKGPIFYGVRLSRWEKERPWGIALDFTHPKSISDTSQVTHVSGIDQGTPVNERRPISDTIDALEMSHGHNFLTLNGMHRWFFGRNEKNLWLYVGAGAGVGIPRVEATINGVKTNEFQIAGPAVQGFLGLNYDLSDWAALFGEYKMTYTDLDMDLDGGGTIGTETFMNQFIVGFTFRF